MQERASTRKLTKKQAQEILNIKGKYTQKVIAEMYGISRGQVSKIHIGKNSWRNLER